MADFVGFMSADWKGARRSLALMLALVSIVLQLNAPVHASVRLTAPGDTGALCSEHVGQRSDQKAPPSRSEACAACIACAATGPLIVAEHLFVAALYAAPLARTIGVMLPAPRGPPLTAPRARGPPPTI